MAYELNIPLDPIGQTGLTIVAKLHSGATLAQTVSLTEAPASSGRYTNAGSLSLAAGVYDVNFIDTASGRQVGTGELAWNGTAEAAASIAGPGADQCTLEFYSDPPTNSQAIADADVWITSDANGDTIVAGTKQTDSEGKVTFLLDAGNTYYVWLQKDEVNSIEGQEFVAEAD